MLEIGGNQVQYNKKQYYLLKFFGITVLILSLFFTHDQGTPLFGNFIIVIVSFGLSVAIKLIVNQYMKIEQYNFFNTLALNSIFKMMLVIFYFYARASNDQTYVGILILFLQCYLLDLVSLIVICYLAEYHVKRQISTYIVTFYFILIVAIGVSVEVELLEPLYRVILMLCIVVIYVKREKWEWISRYILNERIPIFKILLMFMLIQYLFSYFCNYQSNQFSSMSFMFQFLHVFYLFYCAFSVCIASPWEERMHALNEAEEQINEQSKNCDMIVNLSHELKTPVNVIRSALDILVLDVKEEEMIQGVKELKKDCNIVMSIIQDMIDIQKINGHHIAFKFQTYNLVEIIENVMDAFAEELIESQLIFNPKEEEINQVVDGMFMQQCFMLLLGLLIQHDITKKLYVEIREEHKEALISIRIVSANIAYLDKLYEEMKAISKEDKRVEDVANVLTLKLIYAILAVHNSTIVFDSHNLEKELWIYLRKKEEGKVIWLDDRSVASLNDQIKCRYIGV